MVIEAIEAAGIEYLIGGAVASWAWGEPRATQDLDVVVSIPIEAVDKLSDKLQIRDMLVPADIIKGNLMEERGDLPIHAIHMCSGYKADLYPLRADDEHRRAALDRKVKVDLCPDLGQVYIHAPEDLIIYKLWFFSLGQLAHGRFPRHILDFLLASLFGDRLGASGKPASASQIATLRAAARTALPTDLAKRADDGGDLKLPKDLS